MKPKGEKTRDKRLGEGREFSKRCVFEKHSIKKLVEIISTKPLLVIEQKDLGSV